MDSNPLTRELHLAHKAIHRLDHPAGIQLTCREGSVWITLDDDPRDFVLEAGETFRTDQNRRALIYALQPARIGLAPAAMPQTSRGGLHLASSPRAAHAGIA